MVRRIADKNTITKFSCDDLLVLEAAVLGMTGERCKDYDDECSTCKLWKQFDDKNYDAVRDDVIKTMKWMKE